MRFFIISILLVAIVFSSCDFGIESSPPQDPPPNATRILDLEIRPDSVQVDSPVTFITTIEDSTKSYFHYHWIISGVKTSETDTNFWKTTAPDSAKKYEISVTVDDQDPETQSVGKDKLFRVIDTTNKNSDQ